MHDVIIFVLFSPLSVCSLNPFATKHITSENHESACSYGVL